MLNPLKPLGPLRPFWTLLNLLEPSSTFLNVFKLHSVITLLHLCRLNVVQGIQVCPHGCKYWIYKGNVFSLTIMSLLLLLFIGIYSVWSDILQKEAKKITCIPKHPLLESFPAWTSSLFFAGTPYVMVCFRCLDSLHLCLPVENPRLP